MSGRQERMERLLERRRALCDSILGGPSNEMVHRAQLREVQEEIEALALAMARDFHVDLMVYGTAGFFVEDGRIES